MATNAKKTLYEILEVSPGASFPEIKAAHRRLSLKIMSANSGLSREDIEFELKLIDVALHTLSDQASRDAYDGQIFARQPRANAVVPLASDVTPTKLAAAIAETHRITAAVESSDESPLRILSATASSTASALKKIFRVFVGLVALAVVIRISIGILRGPQSAPAAAGVSKAEEKVILQEYYQTHGVRPGSKAEADLLEIEERRKENEQRQAAREQKRAEDDYRRFVEDSRQTADQVSEDLRRAEERARYEAEQKKRQSDQEMRQKEAEQQEAERIRLEEAWRKFGREPPPQ